MGVVRGPREVDPVIHSESWLAWAVGPKGEYTEGTGSHPEQALRMLAEMDTLRWSTTKTPD
jgi:hypothetical protein